MIRDGAAQRVLDRPSRSRLRRVSADHKPPQTYILHTFVIAVVIVVAMVLFLRHQWGGH